MRVVAGTARGLRLVAPEGEGTRPTSDRVREATFNALGSMGALDGATVLDLYAGSGAMGIEALSRGAARATFVETDRAALVAVRANLATTRLAERAEVIARPAEAVLAEARRSGHGWDLAICDPPYGFDGWEDLLAGLPADVVVVEAGHEVGAPPGWEPLRAKRYGRTTVVILARSTGPEGPVV